MRLHFLNSNIPLWIEAEPREPVFVTFLEETSEYTPLRTKHLN